MPPANDAPTDVTPPATERDDGFDFDFDAEVPPPPPRRRRLPLLTAGLALCAAIGAGVLGGILIQKHWGGSGSGGGRGAAALAALSGRGGQAGRGAGGSGARPAGANAFTRGGTVGQVKAIDGTSLYVTDLQGNTVKVTTGPGVRVRVTSDATLKKVRPGDYVTVEGTQTKTGYRATSITDSGTESPLGGLFGGGGAAAGSAPGGQQSGSGGTGNVPALPGLGG
jgi:hypothetical protein